jgi:hypothetical protein
VLAKPNPVGGCQGAVRVHLFELTPVIMVVGQGNKIFHKKEKITS